ncbi:MAG: LacI family DNA-binding transcriptional regulator [Victivallaceae bacterium]|nr:LacI family DNA-binding transcriptional regulator [Victivallaceae bacterium]
MVSMCDVATRAEVSKATVSRVLNGKGVVSANARQKVLDACNELKYKLNFNIQDLVLKSRTGATRNIAFVMVGKEFADPAYARFVDEISSQINKHHYHLMLVKITGQEKTIYDLPPVLRDERIDGILLTGDINPDTVGVMEAMQTQCVVVGNYGSHLLRSLGCVRSNIELPIFDLIEKMAKSGKKRIAFVEEDFDNYCVKQIFEAYKAALKENGLSFDKNICYSGERAFSGIFNTLKPVFCRKELPFDSIFCADLRLAREISHLIIGHFGLERKIDILIATSRPFNYYKLPVPTIYMEQSSEARVEAALQLLIDQIEGKKESQSITVN